MVGGVQGRRDRHRVTSTSPKAIPLQRASEKVREPRRHPGPDHGRPQKAILSKIQYHSQQMHEFLTQIAILRCDVETHVTKYHKLQAFMGRDGLSSTRDPYDGGGGQREARLLTN